MQGPALQSLPEQQQVLFSVAANWRFKLVCNALIRTSFFPAKSALVRRANFLSEPLSIAGSAGLLSRSQARNSLTAGI
jgi:hypothetical protein